MIKAILAFIKRIIVFFFIKASFGCHAWGLPETYISYAHYLKRKLLSLSPFSADFFLKPRTPRLNLQTYPTSL